MKKIFTILICTMGLASCVMSQPVTRLTPEAPEGHFEMGREYISLSNKQIHVELGYDGLFENYLVFDVVVVNGSADPLSIDPSAFHYFLLDSAGADSSVLPPFNVVPPEKILRQYDHIMDARSNEKGLNSIVGFIETGIGILASTSAFLSTENPGYIVDGIFSAVGTTGHYVGQNKQIGNELEQIQSEMELVGDEILRPGEIPPGKVASGYVFFPVFEETTYIMICIPMENQEFQFVYKQEQELL